MCCPSHFPPRTSCGEFGCYWAREPGSYNDPAPPSLVLRDTVARFWLFHRSAARGRSPGGADSPASGDPDALHHVCSIRRGERCVGSCLLYTSDAADE